MNNPEYKLIYVDARHQSKEVATIIFLNKEKFTLQYQTGAEIRLPGFAKSGEYFVDSLWLRVPASIRREEENKQDAFRRFVESFKGRIATDRFQFMPA